MLSTLKRTVLKKRTAVATLAVAAVAAVGYAYWTADGTGTGSVSTGSTSAITVKQTSTISNLYPGGPAQTLSGNFDNPNSGSIYVGSVTASVSSVDKATGVTGTCSKDDYIIGGTANVDNRVPAGNAKGAWTGLTIRLDDTNTNQDACKGATVNIAYTTQTS
jgi:hypothetical protein